MKAGSYVIFSIALIVALGGLLMGFDASVISGVNSFVVAEFDLTELELGWSVSCLTLSAALAMLLSGPLSDRIGRRTVLRYAAILYAISAVSSAIAPNFTAFWVARMIGGFGVGASLILAPMYIAEIAPPHMRGRMVSFNQLNIVIGLSLAFFSNYLILQWSKSDAGWVEMIGLDETQWRWMLGVEAVPAIAYYFGLFLVPRSPRWLCLRGEFEEARKVLGRLTSDEEAAAAIQEIRDQDSSGEQKVEGSLSDLFKPAMRLVLTIGLVVAVLQQITGINSVFFYAPMIFEQTGIGTDASFVMAIFVGLVNLLFTVLAILFIDKLGRKPLLSFGVAGMAISMFLLSFSFSTATFTLTQEQISALPETVNQAAFAPIVGQVYESEEELKAAIVANAPTLEQSQQNELVKQGTVMDPMVVLFGILGFVASFAISIGPVMWVLFSELFPNKIRGIAISSVGLVNSLISFLVQWIFPWELSNLGSTLTFLLYGIFALLGLIFIIRKVPETKGKSLEELEAILVK